MLTSFCTRTTALATHGSQAVCELRSSRRSTWILRSVALLSTLAVAVACSAPDLSGPVSADASQLYWQLVLSAHAITMDTLAPYNTLQLTAVAQNAFGAPLADAPAVTFSTTDSSVRVSPTGLLTARFPRNNVQVAAVLTYRGIRLTDTATINVTAGATPPASRQLSFGLQMGDTATIALPNLLSVFYFPAMKSLRAVAQDSTGTQIQNALVALRSSDTLKATVPKLTANGIAIVSITGTLGGGVAGRLGPVMIYASATVYGVAIQDSVQLTITAPLLAQFQLSRQTVIGTNSSVLSLAPTFSQVIGRGGIIWWYNSVEDSLDIVFDDPSVATADVNFLNTGNGNVAPFSGCVGLLENCDNVRSRQFLRPGVVHFHSTLAGVTGTIVVQ